MSVPTAKQPKGQTRKVNKAAKLATRIVCLLFVAGPLIALLFYPRARWLFAFAILGIVVLVLLARFLKDPSPIAVADHAQRLLDGTGTWDDVDNYEQLNPREPQLHDLWQRTMKIGGLPEVWPTLDEGRKVELQNIIRALRDLAGGRK